jgi:hypothetical protein
MEIKSPRIVTVSAGFGGLIEQSIKKYNFESYSCRFFNNRRPLCSIYNYEIEKAYNEGGDCIILVHDDVILEENPIPKLEKLFDDYDLVGVAGTSKIELKSPALWHLMGGGFQSGNLHGKVQHLYKEIISYMPLLEREGKTLSDFGPIPKQVVMIDGVFMAMNRKVMEKMRFDRKNPCKYHFYDLIFSLDCHLNGFKVGVGDILITHESPGLREFTDDWRNGEKYFLSKYEEK